MPDHYTHTLVDKIIFGRSYPKVHRAKDKPARFLGPSHRKYYHDPLTGLVIACQTYPGDVLRAYASSLIHDLLDQVSTDLKRKRTRLIKKALRF